jgi:methylmalonyl-CoA mutase N-terminal domain/subunit
VKAALSAIGDSAKGKNPALMPLIIDAVRARASVGEIADSLRKCWGEYRP